MNKEELDLLEIVFTLAIGECAYNDINNIQKLEDKIKTIGNLCKKQKEVIDRTINAIDLVIELIKQQPTEDDKWILDRLNGFKIILEDKEVSR